MPPRVVDRELHSEDCHAPLTRQPRERTVGCAVCGRVFRDTSPEAPAEQMLAVHLKKEPACRKAYGYAGVVKGQAVVYCYKSTHKRTNATETLLSGVTRDGQLVVEVVSIE